MIAAYVTLHYGKEWLGWAIRSVLNEVDRVFVVYTPTPSFGHGTSLKCPDTRSELKLICDMLGSKVTWVDANRVFHWEGEHREFAMNVCKAAHADTVVVLDEDELWAPGLLRYMLDLADNDPAQAGIYHITMMHFYRSLHWACRDGHAPSRIIKPQRDQSIESYTYDRYVFHMGYAQSAGIIQYKQDIHGHKDEWRPDWYQNKFLDWKPGVVDVHPVIFDWWTPERYNDESGALKAVAGDHPYWNIEIIP